jgi:hypothetical protein
MDDMPQRVEGIGEPSLPLFRIGLCEAEAEVLARIPVGEVLSVDLLKFLKAPRMRRPAVKRKGNPQGKLTRGIKPSVMDGIVEVVEESELEQVVLVNGAFLEPLAWSALPFKNVSKQLVIAGNRKLVA